MTEEPVNKKGEAPISGRKDVSLGKLAAITWIGSTLDLYDLFIAGLAAGLVWPVIFFAAVPKSVAYALSLGTYGATLIARPFGSAIFGHFGDTRGRKVAFIFSLVVTGIATLAVGLLPGYSVLGILAPVLLIVMRIFTGLGIGGEGMASTTLMTEFAHKSEHRGFFAGVSAIATESGIVLASVAFAVIADLYVSKSAFDAIGWRIPFFIGAFAAFMAAVLRYTVRETPMFEELVKNKQVSKAPLKELFTEDRKRFFKVLVAFLFVTGSFSVLVSPYSVSYLTFLGISHKATTTFLLVGSLSGLGTVIIGALLGDIIGRKMVLFISIGVTVIFAYPFFLLLHTQNYTLIIIAYIILVGAIEFGLSQFAFVTENFRTRVRTTGSGVSYYGAGLVGGVIVGFLTPVIVAYSAGPVHAAPIEASISIILGILSFISILSLKETKGRELQ